MSALALALDQRRALCLALLPRGETVLPGGVRRLPVGVRAPETARRRCRHGPIAARDSAEPLTTPASMFQSWCPARSQEATARRRPGGHTSGTDPSFRGGSPHSLFLCRCSTRIAAGATRDARNRQAKRADQSFRGAAPAVPRQRAALDKFRSGSTARRETPSPRARRRSAGERIDRSAAPRQP